MDILTYILAIFAHGAALVLGLTVLYKFKEEFSERPHVLKNGLDDVEVCYLTIVLSTLLAPLSIYHLIKLMVNIQDVSDITIWRAVYWLALGLLLSLFHVLTKHLMGRLRKNGATGRFSKANH